TPTDPGGDTARGINTGNRPGLAENSGVFVDPNAALGVEQRRNRAHCRVRRLQRPAAPLGAAEDIARFSGSGRAGGVQRPRELVRVRLGDLRQLRLVGCLIVAPGGEEVGDLFFVRGDRVTNAGVEDDVHWRLGSGHGGGETRVADGLVTDAPAVSVDEDPAVFDRGP